MIRRHDSLQNISPLAWTNAIWWRWCRGYAQPKL